MTVYEELKARGLIAQTTNEERIKELVDSGKAVFYIGYDPTADSLTAGHFLVLAAMKRLQMAGNRPIVLIGGGTTMVGDPSGRSDMRRMLTAEEIAQNGERFKEQMGKLLDFGEGGAIMVNNADWLLGLNYVDFLRDIGVHFSVNRMLTADCFRTRMEKEGGLTFIEFNYMIMQSYDFLVLNEKYGCVLQCGGDDQWSNMINGADLIRRKTGREAHALTFTLLLTANGEKMGKTQQGALWLDPAKTSPYDFFQYWRNVDDADVVNCLKLLTFVPLGEITEMAKLEGSALNPVKERLAYELTAIVHSQEEAERARGAARSVFAQGDVSGEMPTTVIAAGDLDGDGISVLDLLVKCALAPSKGEARRLIDQGGVEIDSVKVKSVTEIVNKAALENGVVVKKGKKVYHKAVM